MSKAKFGTRVYHCPPEPIDIDAYSDSANGITIEIRRKEYDLHKWNSRQIKRKQAEINKLKLIRSQIQGHIENQLIAA